MFILLVIQTLTFANLNEFASKWSIGIRLDDIGKTSQDMQVLSYTTVTNGEYSAHNYWWITTRTSWLPTNYAITYYPTKAFALGLQGSFSYNNLYSTNSQTGVNITTTNDSIQIADTINYTSFGEEKYRSYYLSFGINIYKYFMQCKPISPFIKLTPSGYVERGEKASYFSRYDEPPASDTFINNQNDTVYNRGINTSINIGLNLSFKAWDKPFSISLETNAIKISHYIREYTGVSEITEINWYYGYRTEYKDISHHQTYYKQPFSVQWNFITSGSFEIWLKYYF